MTAPVQTREVNRPSYGACPRSSLINSPIYKILIPRKPTQPQEILVVCDKYFGTRRDRAFQNFVIVCVILYNVESFRGDNASGTSRDVCLSFSEPLRTVPPRFGSPPKTIAEINAFESRVDRKSVV